MNGTFPHTKHLHQLEACACRFPYWALQPGNANLCHDSSPSDAPAFEVFNYGGNGDSDRWTYSQLNSEQRYAICRTNPSAQGGGQLPGCARLLQKPLHVLSFACMEIWAG